MRQPRTSLLQNTFHVTTRLTITLLVCLCVPVPGMAQFSSPPNFSLTPFAVVQGSCYSIKVPNWPGAVLNVGYTTAWSGQRFIYGWPSLDYNGNAFICTNSDTHLGAYTYNAAANLYYNYWWTVNATVVVNPYVPPQQPTALTFIPNSGYAGLDCYTMSLENAGGITVDLNYMFNSLYQPMWSTALDAGGQWRYCINHHDQVGTYVFYQMKNHLAANWISVAPPASYQAKAPQPAWFLITPATLLQGNAYEISAGNGAAVTMDIQYTLNGGALQTITAWPTLAPSDNNYGYNGSSTGYTKIWTGSTTPLGKYIFTGIRNTQNTDWFAATAELSVCPSSLPTISTITPAAVLVASNGQIIITGANLCATVLQSTSGGVSFSNVSWSYPFTSLTATATASNSALVGPGQLRLTTPAGSVTAQFAVAPPAVLSKEYIYLGDRVITTVAP